MRTAIIIGAGPAGLTAAYELLTRTDIKPFIVEADGQVGGLSKTIHYKGNRIDIGGHRFFSKSEKVMDWWLHFLPIGAEGQVGAPGEDQTMLVRPRKSRIYYGHHFFDYPLQLNRQMIRNLGVVKMTRIGLSYIKAKLFPIAPEENLEAFFINRFGGELYRTFFSGYTEKVWGVPCRQIPSSWGHQRIRELNISRLLGHWVRSLFHIDKSLHQKGTSTSLIEQFLYPKFGPGQMWETVAKEVVRLGGQISLRTTVTALHGAEHGDRLTGISVQDEITGKSKVLTGDYFFSTMPVQELVGQLQGLPVPEKVQRIAAGLEYRDFLIVGILTSALTIRNDDAGPIKDNWIYIQDDGVKAGRLQFFHNWSPYMVENADAQWLGVEYFCSESDAFWQRSEEDIKNLAIGEMESIGVLRKEDVLDTVVVKVKKAYPSYYGTYSDFGLVREFLEKIGNLYPVGRNGMHRYNNSDHSMLTAMVAVDNIISGRMDKRNIWEVNTEEEYHEEKK